MKKIILAILIILTLMIGCLIYLKIYNNTKYKPQENNVINENNIRERDMEETKEDLIGTLEIRKIGVIGPVKEGSSKEVLKEYIGHIENTPVFDGNVCLAAHNRGNQYSYFARLNELEYGDEILYTTKFYKNHYNVDNIKEIDEKDWSLLEDTSENRLTLITCIKNKRNKRLCVQATKADNH